MTLGGAYFEIAETDSLQGGDGGIFVQTVNNDIIDVYGAFSEFAGGDKIGLNLHLINKDPQHTRFDFNASK